MTTSSNSLQTALADEFEAINAIYGSGTVHTVTSDGLPTGTTTAVLTLPRNVFSFSLIFDRDYPESIPTIGGIESVASRRANRKGFEARNLLEDALHRIWTPGQVCLFDLVEEVCSVLVESDDGAAGTDVDRVLSTPSPEQPEHALSTDGISAMMYGALVRTHHITSRKKIASLKKAAKKYACSVLLKSGGTPGIMFVESTQKENVSSWLDTVHSLRYKDYHIVASAAHLSGRGTSLSNNVCKFEEVEAVKDFAAKMEELGVLRWWRKAMSFTPD